MRHARQLKILEIINQYELKKQEEITALLKESGFDVTQATVSRDIKDLQLVKTLTDNGAYKYIEPSNLQSPQSNRFINIFKETIKSVSYGQNLVVVKTLSGCASAAAEALDNLDLGPILGTLAGDNTIFIALESNESAPLLVEKLSAMIK